MVMEITIMLVVGMIVVLEKEPPPPSISPARGPASTHISLPPLPFHRDDHFWTPSWVLMHCAKGSDKECQEHDTDLDSYMERVAMKMLICIAAQGFGRP